MSGEMNSDKNSNTLDSALKSGGTSRTPGVKRLKCISGITDVLAPSARSRRYRYHGSSDVSR